MQHCTARVSVTICSFVFNVCVCLLSCCINARWCVCVESTHNTNAVTFANVGGTILYTHHVITDSRAYGNSDAR